MELELMCGKCQRPFDNPVLLSCGHSMCEAHIPAKASSSSSTSVPCPVCEQITRVPTEGLRGEAALQILVDVWRENPHEIALSSSSGSSAAPRTLCGICERKHATRFCVQCDGPICGDCEKTEHAKALFRNHRIINLLSDSGKPAASADVIAQRMYCQHHASERLNFYCLDCRKLVCSHCLILGDHKGHRQRTLLQAVDAGKETLTAWLDALKKRIAANGEFLEKLHTVEYEVQTNAEEQRNIINKEMDHLRELVETKRRQLLSKCSLEQNQKRVQLQAQIDSTDKIRQDAVTLVGRSQALLAVPNKHAFLGVVLPLIQDMRKSASQEIDTDPKVSTSFKPFSTDYQNKLVQELELGATRPSLSAPRVAAGTNGNTIASAGTTSNGSRAGMPSALSTTAQVPAAPTGVSFSPPVGSTPVHYMSQHSAMPPQHQQLPSPQVARSVSMAATSQQGIHGK